MPNLAFLDRTKSSPASMAAASPAIGARGGDDDRVFAPRHVGGRGILRKGGRGKRRAGERGESEFAIHDNSCFEARASATHSQKQGVLRGGGVADPPRHGEGDRSEEPTLTYRT